MQKNSSSIKSSTDILKQAIQFIGQHNITAIPINYTVSYEYCRGHHVLLRQAIDQAIVNKQPITNEAIQGWFDAFLLGYDLSELNKSHLDLNNIVDQLASTTTQAEEDVNQYDTSLKECKDELNETLDTSSLSSIVSSLLTSTTAMQIAMEQMKQQITASQCEIASLQDRLALVTIEAVTDPLTGLANRKGLSMAINESLSTALQSKNYPCLLLLDIDYFKKINDSFGHLVGDKAIKILADTLKKQLKGKDTAARYGGEEFAILLPETDLQNAWKVGENIRRVVESLRITRSNNHEEVFRMTISIGIARYQANQSINDLIELADNALYQSKNTGRNRVTIFETKL
ncbi:GGDEF domain-containing protein [Methylomonas methanica]|uniref:diguanylate cyclase n=1 Tax=Methylomonas methanica (strain DSM 25384 / MC09) TaxID=857087 RepID=G0A6D2_METMM|nr:GGDEF domain-containing protein [Methylomonas methanica]AEG01760.1 diguanylate cyclase [Methylomonas methanica MC09]